MNNRVLLNKNNKGATMAEYAIIAAVIVTVAILAFTGLGRAIVVRVQNLASGF